MRQFRRIGGTAFAALLLTAVVGGPAASAQTETKTPETYVGTAAGRVLTLKVGENGLTAGASSASIDSTLKAVAQGTGYLSPLGSQQTDKLEQVGEGVKQVSESCAGDLSALPAPISNIIQLGVGCASALAQVQNGLPRAASTGKVAGLGVDVTTITSQLPLEDVLGQVLTPVLGGVDQVEAVLSGIVGSPVEIGDSVQQVTDALLTTKTLEVELGQSAAETVNDGSKIISTATSAGGTIKLFPLGAELLTDAGVELKPIVEIIIGSAKATAVYDRATGKSTPSFDPAILTINVNTPVVDSLGGITGQDLSTIVINPDIVPSQLAALDPVAGAVITACPDAPNEFCILAGTPLETRIAIASGRTVTNADGSVGAVADAVKINALRNIADVGVPLPGGILLELAHAEAGVGGAPAQLITIAAPEVPRELPRTGGPAVLPMVAVAGLGLALAARRTIARVNR
jgi:hypothetical protein